MNHSTKEILDELLNICEKSKQINYDNNFKDNIIALFSVEKNFEAKITELNITALYYNIPDDITELIFDIMLFDFFGDTQKHESNYFETKEWLKIEEKILDRGTELFNILLYLRECADNNFDISLDDYIDEYLMCEDDFENLETQYYEDIIKNRELLKSHDIDVFFQVAILNSNGPLESQLLPILLFFCNDADLENKLALIEQNGDNPTYQIAFLSILNKYKNINNLKHEFINN